MAGSAFRDARVVDLVKRDFVPVLVDVKSAADARWVREHGAQLTPHVVFADSEGEQWGFLSDYHGADAVLAEADQAMKLMREGVTGR
jgi:hypothetical protein